MNITHYPLATFLVSLGLSEKEATVYLTLLPMGTASVSEIARQSGMNRTTGYHILNSLIGKGLVSISGKEPKQEYIAESPDQIITLLQKQKENAEELMRNAENIVPQLKSMHNISDRPRVRFYEGVTGLKEVYEDTLTSHETIRAYATVDDMHHALPNYFPRYYSRRIGKGIRIRAIIPKTKMGIERASLDEVEGRETALIPPDEYYFSPEINIYDNKVMIASWREKLGIIIESTEIADAMKKIYELAWVQAKRLDANDNSLQCE